MIIINTKIAFYRITAHRVGFYFCFLMLLFIGFYARLVIADWARRCGAREMQFYGA